MTFAKEIRIGEKFVGSNHEVFFSCEVGTTHNGEFDKALKIIEGAASAGVDAVKFQILGAGEIFSDKSITYTYTTADGETKTENLPEMIERYRFTLEEWKRLREAAESKGLVFFATVDYPGGIDIAEELEVPAYKICSWDLTYYPFIRTIAKLKKPVVLDTGPVNEEGLERVLKIFQEEGNEQVVVLHCYHTENPQEVNMRSIEYIRDRFGVLTGFSAPNRDVEPDILALAFEPVMVEKRLTFDWKNKQHHHALALEPEEMKEYVQTMRRAEHMVGKGGIFPSPGDIEIGKTGLRRIVAKRDIKAGEVLTEENLDCKRPQQGGLHPVYWDSVLGKTAKRDFTKDEPLCKEDVES